MFLKQLISLFAHHRNASNLLMIIMLGIGVFSIFKINTQFFPTIGLDRITISVPWAGASAEDVESNIIEAIEPELRFLDELENISSFASEGNGTILLEYVAGADMQLALSNVDSAIGRITTLPEDSERPVVSRLVRYDTISRISLSGPFSEASLKVMAKQMRDELLDLGIAKVSLTGARKEEIQVNIAPQALLRYDLTLADIGRRISTSSQDMPSGTLEGNADVQIRSLGLAKQAESIGEIEIRALENGEKILLSDVANIEDAFKEGGIKGLRYGIQAISLLISRAESADALKQSKIVHDYVDRIKPTLPQGLELMHYNVQSDLIEDRISLLLRNGVSGLFLVLAVLFLFLNGRLAFWVAVGIPTALFATMGVMLVSGQTINMLSLFALIMTLGIIVDDAIVVGEHAATRRARGMKPIEAAEAGAVRMLAPVLSSSLTTIAAFMPIFMISSIIGQIIAAIPFVVIAVLVASLVECFLVLPGHLREALPRVDEKPGRFRVWFDGHFGRFRDGAFERIVTKCVEHRYVTLSGTVALLIISIGMVTGGRVPFNFFPSPEADTVFANVIFAPGTPREQTERMIRSLEEGMRRAEMKITDGKGGLITASFAKVGQSQAQDFGAQSGDHLGGIHVELVASDYRTVRTADFVEVWRNEITPLPGIDRVTLATPAVGPPGKEIDIRFSNGTTTVLKAASEEVQNLLKRLPGVSDVADNLPYGKSEIILKVTPQGKALGFTTQDVGRQVRDAFQGNIAKRFARGDEEVTVRVQLPRDDIGRGALRDLYLRGPGGVEVPLSEIVEMSESQGFSRIRREDGAREVSVVAEVDETLTTAAEVVAALNSAGIAEIAKRHGVDFRFKGKFEETARTMGEVQTGAIVGLMAIYIVLAWVFASYTRPFVVMAIIPFGVVGAIVGHLVMGYSLSILSLISLMGLAGILVNNSIILVSTIEERIAEGEEYLVAVIGGSKDRVRAVLLTSLTTMGGLLPLLFETSLQAQFLIPMAVTLVFGLGVATALVLIVVPSLMVMQRDVANIRDRVLGRVRKTTSASVPAE
ncbi:MAG: efflux RND transporter permease subunit [Alphaproteobacteria bacterium]|jgi:multidrug efflux pump subunit AcrB|nr:efflux RND transporter permease subunit [Alphaproteobacteria bacterium]MBT5162157.1 efflux RND transporter permease subunit [Alphaproteobacteria bacterium]MBT5919554.1 efflux RND transporter permease subunit [Alphaproteobacteria bacterium]MBT6385402.1 efflux RND transporter permease subunit [Alphaproteobacteria bacterium]